MRSIITSLLALMVLASLSLAQCCGGSGHGSGLMSGKKGGSCCGMAGTASFTDPHMTPDCAPQPVHDFHRVLMPFLEAHANREPSYIRDNAQYLFAAAKPVPDSKKCCATMDKKAFKTSAKELVEACEQLQKLSSDKSVKDDAVLSQMKLVEDDFVALSNNCQ